MRLSRKDKNIIRYGTFMEQTSLLIDHFDDKDKKWVVEARKYFHKCNLDLFNSKNSATAKTNKNSIQDGNNANKISEFKPLNGLKGFKLLLIYCYIVAILFPYGKNER